MKLKVLLSSICIAQFCIAQQGTFTELKQICEDQKERPFVVYSSPNNKKNKPLLIFLHGAVSSSEVKKNPIEYAKKSPLLSLADEGNFDILFSFGQKGATWFDTTGQKMVLSEIEQAKNIFKINKDKIYLCGFSDGGSGVFYFSMTYPHHFTGFIPMNGSIKVANQLGEMDIFPENSNQKPMLIFNTDKDMLYPLEQISPTIEYLSQFNQNIDFKQVNGLHEMSYLNDVKDKIINFINQHSIKPATQWSWETTDNHTDINWLKINTISDEKTENWHQNYSLKIMNNKADFGIKFDYNFTGKGMKVAGFKTENSTAKKMGVEIGDIILKMEDFEMKNPYSPMLYAGNKKAGDPTTLTILRNSETKILNGKFNEGYPYEVFQQKKASGKINLNYNDKTLIINTSKINDFEINLKEFPYKVKKIILNGKDIPIKNKNLFQSK